MRYELSTADDRVYLEVIDDDGDSTFHSVIGNVIGVTETFDANRIVLASGSGDWHYFDGIAEFRAKMWKIRCEGDTCSVRTGDGEKVPHLFSGVGPGRTGESAARRFISFFDGTDFSAATPQGC